MFASERILLLRCLPGNSMVGISSVLWLTISPRSVLIKPFHVPGLLKKSPNHFLIVPRPGFRAPTDNLTTFSNPFSGASRTLPKPQGKHEKVRLLSSPLKNPGFPRVFRISCQLLWLSCLSMHVHACRCCPCRNRRLVRCLGPQKYFSESSSESPESSSNPRFSGENMWFCSGGAGFELVELES